MNIDEFLETYPEAIAALSRQLRQLVQARHPGSEETLHVGWRVISYASGKKYCAIAPHADWVNLQFHHGATLNDPEGLLEGTGQSMRHVKIQSEADLTQGLTDLIDSAQQEALAG